MTGPKTLTEARELIEAAETQITTLSATLAASDGFLKDAGIVRTVTEDGSVLFEIPQIAALNAQNAALAESVASLTADNKTLAELAAGRETAIECYKAEIAQLEASAKTAESRARELVGNLGGLPLAVDGSDSMELTEDVLRTQLQATKEPSAQLAIYRRLKAQEAKSKNRINGTK